MTIAGTFSSGVALVVTILAVLGFLPSPYLLDISPQEFKLQEPPELTGPLAPNNLLDSAEKLYEGQIINPECIDIYNGALYTGLENGRVVRLKDGQVDTVFVSGGKDCNKVPGTCGRPNGLKFDYYGNLIVADPLKGIYKLNVDTGEIEVLFSSKNPVDGKIAKGCNFPNIAKNGDVYFSDPTTKWDMHQNYYEFLEYAPNGRVLHYDAKTGTTKTLVDGLYFPNGVHLSPNEDFLIIAQSSKYNILKYHLTGPKKGELEVFVDNLPGIPDNIHATDRGTFWVGIVGVRLPDKPMFFEAFGPYPLIRKILGRLIYITSMFLDWLSNTLQLQFVQTAKEMFASMKFDLIQGVHYGFIIEVDWDGNIIRSLQSPSGHLQHISHVLETNGVLYLGTPFHNVLGKVNIS